MDDWLSHLGGPPQEEDVDEDDNEDFYGYATNMNNVNGEVKAGAVEMDQNTHATKAHKDAPKAQQTTLTAEERKAENQRKADLLRAKLIAQRQNTPRQSTPMKAISRPDTPSRPPVVLQQDTASVKQNRESMGTAPSSDALGLDSLLAEGRAAAEAKDVRSQGPSTVKETVAQTTLETHSNQDTKPVVQPADIEQTPQRSPSDNNKPDIADTDKSDRRPTQLTDPYYADLPAWLEMTGYHDVEYRNSKLHTYKERRALEQEAARIAERLESLRQAEQAIMEQLRASGTHTVPASRPAPPALPAVMPSDDAAVMADVAKRITNGVKRAHSPVPVEKSSRRREESAAGFKIRGATNDSPEVRPSHRQSPLSLDRRLSYPDGRRTSRDDPASRDPSLERRQAYYRRDGEPNAGYRREEPGPRYDQYAPRDSRETPRAITHRSANPGYGTVGRSGGYRDLNQAYRGSAALDLRKGGVRYFMIKSWNHENVLQSMRDGLWATQTKNEHILTEAYTTARHVILLFSVNKSMAFQGYALMTSPPDPTLPKPSFCTKLNWSTSPAFTLRWLATTAVHFRMVGHLKNTCNVDEVTGEPRAVLVGKDGQEISGDAGLGVVRVLDEAEALESPASGPGVVR